MEHGSAPLSDPSTIAIILSFRVSRETFEELCKKVFTKDAVHLKAFPSQTSLLTGTGASWVCNHADSELDRFDWKTSRYIRGHQQQALLLRRIQGQQRWEAE